jgi:hypothetical protein
MSEGSEASIKLVLDKLNKCAGAHYDEDETKAFGEFIPSIKFPPRTKIYLINAIHNIYVKVTRVERNGQGVTLSCDDVD